MKNFLRIILLATLALMASHVVNSVPPESNQGNDFSSVSSENLAMSEHQNIKTDNLEVQASVDNNIYEKRSHQQE